MNTTEHAASIRGQLKKMGWSSRDVSIRANYYSMGSSIDVNIKNPRVSLEKVKKIAEQAEVIRRDDYSGEILGGGNRFVHVSYTSEAMQELCSKYLPAINIAVARLARENENALIDVEGTPYLIGKNQHGRLSLWSDSHLAECWDVQGIAREIAVRMNQ